MCQYDSETNNNNDSTREVVNRDMKPRMSTEVSKNHVMYFFEVEGVTCHQLLSLENSVPLLIKQLALLEYPLSQSNSAADFPFYVPETKNVLERV